MIQQLIMLLLSIGVAVLAGLMLFSSRDSSRTIIRDAIVSGTLGALLLTLVLLQYDLVGLREIKDKIVQPNPLAQLNDMLKQTSRTVPMRTSIMDRKEKIETELSNILNGKISLRDSDEVITEWKRLFSEAKTNVNATNYVSPDFWLKGSDFSRQQFDIQSTAKKRGVSIRRIFIYSDSSTEEREQIRKLSQQQKSVGIETKFLSYDRVQSSTYFMKHQAVLNGAVDFVIYDTSVVLLTFPNPSSRRIEQGMLTKERQVTDAAMELFDKLWAIAEEKI